MALGLLGELGVEEITRGPQPVGCERAPHRVEKRGRPGQQARLEERRGDAEVGERLLPAVVDRAHAVAGLEPDVPEERKETLEGRGQRRIRALWQQHHHVDVGAGQEFAAAVAADREQRSRARGLAGVQLPGADHECVDECRAVAHQRLDRFFRLEASREFAVALDERCAKLRGVPGRRLRDGRAGSRGRTSAELGRSPIRPRRGRPRRASVPRNRQAARAPCAPTGPTGNGPW